jgi:hypothetical protein
VSATKKRVSLHQFLFNVKKTLLVLHQHSVQKSRELVLILFQPNQTFEINTRYLLKSGDFRSYSQILDLAETFCEGQTREYKRGKCHCTINLLFDWFGISCTTNDNFCFYLQNRLIQTSQTGGQWYSDTSPFSIRWTSNTI